MLRKLFRYIVCRLEGICIPKFCKEKTTVAAFFHRTLADTPKKRFFLANFRSFVRGRRLIIEENRFYIVI